MRFGIASKHLVIASLAAIFMAHGTVAQTTAPATQPATADVRIALTDVSAIEKQTLDQLLRDSSWPRRAIAAVRLERFGCDRSRDMLVKLLDDKVWQVRAFAVRSLARRRIPEQDGWFSLENEPRVLRTALRYHYHVDPSRLQRGVRTLSKSNDLEEKMLGAEIGAASGDDELNKLALETAKQVILKMDRVQAGVLSPRLAAVMHQPDMRRQYEWQRWLLKAGRSVKVHPAYSIDEGSQPLAPSLLAQLDGEQFSGMVEYMAKLSRREVDLAICLDCTASMGREISAAQGGIDDTMLFVANIVSSLRVALVAYRDDKDEFETKAWDFNPDVGKVRDQLWQLWADGGGDEPEAVFPAMKLAFTQLNWRSSASKVLVIVGDAPPHIGFGAQCVSMAQRAHDEARVITHCIEVRGKEVKHFPEIAKAGGGRCVPLKNGNLLMAEITGLSLGDRYQDEFREFFQSYLELCR